MTLTPKNWDEFQHYKDRAPVWIKLHRGLLDDFNFSRLPVASRALAPLLWLLASEYEDGKITASIEEIAFRLRTSEPDIIEALNPLIDTGFFISDSKPLSVREQDACLEKRREEKKNVRLKPDDSDFEAWYKIYPRREAKRKALKAYRSALGRVDAASLLEATNRAIVRFRGTDPKFIPLPASWLNADRWLDEPAGQNGRGPVDGIV